MVSDGLYETIGTRFERQAAATPDNLAVVTDELSLTVKVGCNIRNPRLVMGTG